MASQNFSRANLIVFPQLSLTGSTFDHQHNKLPHAQRAFSCQLCTLRYLL
jgi:predicted amidohydrolase